MKRAKKKFYSDLGRRLQSLRAKLQLTEAQAAEDHGVQLPTYRRWEAGGRRHGKHRSMINFCKKHRVTYDFYLTGKRPTFYPVAGVQS